MQHPGVSHLFTELGGQSIELGAYGFCKGGGHSSSSQLALELFVGSRAVGRRWQNYVRTILNASPPSKKPSLKVLKPFLAKVLCS